MRARVRGPINCLSCLIDDFQQITCFALVGKWPESLWKEYKLDHTTYDRYLFACRDGVLGRKRNLEAVLERETQDAEDEEMSHVSKRIRAQFKPFPKLPAADSWPAHFRKESDRYTFLLALGPSQARPSGPKAFSATLLSSKLVL